MALDINNLPAELQGCESVLRGNTRYLELLDPRSPVYDPRYTRIVRVKAGLEVEVGPHFRVRDVFDTKDKFLAPSRMYRHDRVWEGIISKKPWDYKITAVIPHMDTPDLLKIVIETLRAQTERPYILVIDCGSLQPHRKALEVLDLTCDDLEVHYIRSKAWKFTSEPVTAAMDLAFTLCRSEFLYATHTDVFLKKQNFLEYLLSLYDDKTPVIGHQMSPRFNWKTDMWQRVVSHTATLYHMPTMRRIGGLWSLQAAYESLNMPVRQLTYDEALTFDCVPDTEVNLSFCMHRAGMVERFLEDPHPGENDPSSVLFLGIEPNEPYETEWFYHERSTTGLRVYDPGRAEKNRQRLIKTIEETKLRLFEWNKHNPTYDPDKLANNSERTATAPSPPQMGAMPQILIKDGEGSRPPTPKESLDLQHLVAACPHRTVEPGCGCGGKSKCAIGKGKNGIVFELECMACVLSDGKYEPTYNT